MRPPAPGGSKSAFATLVTVITPLLVVCSSSTRLVIAPPVAIANAVCDALKPLAIEINATPVRSADIAREFLKGV